MFRVYNELFIAPLEFASSHALMGNSDLKHPQVILQTLSKPSSFQDQEFFQNFNELGKKYGCAPHEVLLKLSSEKKTQILFLEQSIFIEILKQWYQTFMLSKEETHLNAFLKCYELDIRLKASRYFHSDRIYHAMRSFRAKTGPVQTQSELRFFPHPNDKSVNYSGISFEWLLYNFLASYGSSHKDNESQISPSQEQIQQTLSRKVEELSWKKLIYDWLVIKEQIINAFSNDLSLLLASPHTFSQDPAKRLQELKEHPSFNWIFDEKFAPENWEYVQKTYSTDVYATLYSSWVRYRQKQNLDAENTEYLRLKSIFKDFKDKNWIKLLFQNLNENWAPVYVESLDAWRFNTAFVSQIYNSFNLKNLSKFEWARLKSFQDNVT